MNTNIRNTIEALRRDAATCLASKDFEVRSRAAGYLRMVEVLKVQLLSKGEDVTVVSKEGSLWRKA